MHGRMFRQLNVTTCFSSELICYNGKFIKCGLVAIMWILLGITALFLSVAVILLIILACMILIFSFYHIHSMIMEKLNKNDDTILV